jgi:hypothetical protein
MDVVFNELSLEPSADAYEARAVMQGITSTLAAGIRFRRLRSLRTDSQFVARNIAMGYRVADWLTDRQVDLEARRLIQTLATKAPYVEELSTQLQGDRLAEFCYLDREALGLGVAVLLDEPSLSAAGRSWQIDPVYLEAKYLVADELVAEQHAVCNVYSPDCWERRGDWLDERARLRVTTGADIVNDEDGLFGWLAFAEAAIVQIRGLTGNEPEFVSIVRHLAALSKQAASWREGPFINGYPFPCSPDSAPTLAQYGASRRIKCPDGQTRTFSWHSKVNVGARRIYFHAERVGDKVTIGYVGPHLPTVRG